MAIDDPSFTSVSGALVTHKGCAPQPIATFLGDTSPLKILTVSILQRAKGGFFCAEIPMVVLPGCIDQEYWDTNNWVLVKGCRLDAAYEYTLFLGIKTPEHAAFFTGNIAANTLTFTRAPVLPTAEEKKT